jgi:ABC-type multidrug transport system fused ATPase/permease subunit
MRLLKEKTMSKETKKAPGAVSQIFHFIRPGAKSFLPGLFLSTISEVLFYLGIPLTIKIMIDAAVEGDFSGLWKGIALILSISVTGAVLFFFFLYMFFTGSLKITAKIRIANLSHALNLPMPYFEKNHSGDTVTRLTNDVQALRNCYDWPLWNLICTIFAGTGAAIAMIILDWRVSLLLIASSIIFAILDLKFAKIIRKMSDGIQTSTGKVTERLSNILAGFSVIKQFHLHETMKGEFEEDNEEVLRLSIRRASRSASLESYNSLIGWINFSGVLVLGAFMAGKNLMSFGTMVAMVNYLWNINRMLRETGHSIANYQGFLAGAARVRELEDEAEEPKAPEAGSYTKDGPDNTALTMRGIRFSYEETKETLAGFDFEAPEGKTAALVGPSGGGKSTVLKLLLGFYEPSAGSIVLGGSTAASIKGTLDYDGIRRAIAYVPQDPFLFDGTVAQNIGYGKTGASTDEIIQAAKGAYAHDFIATLENGYDTVVGERGIRLSGGQKQRIAIARALLRDSPVLLFDEATSSLDSQSEKSIQAALKTLGGKKTIIIVAHRLSTIEDADIIYVVDKGRAVEKGTHTELLKKGGLYKKLHDMQFTLEEGAANLEQNNS